MISRDDGCSVEGGSALQMFGCAITVGTVRVDEYALRVGCAHVQSWMCAQLGGQCRPG